MTTATDNKFLENRVLVLMPTGRDSTLVCATLGKVGIVAETCANTEDLTEKINSGAGAILLAEEALEKKTLEQLSDSFNEQPVWSDLPIVLFAGNAQNAEMLAATVGTRFNATIVERPIRIPMLISAVRGALRARERQYQSRNLLHQLEESDRQKDLFLATLSHELRTPLNSILGWIQLLRSEPSERINLKHALSVIERNARAQSEMIADILFVSRIITGKLKLNLEQIDLISVVQTAIDIMRPSLEAREIVLKTAFESAVNQIAGDSDQLQQVFGNLLSNAIKFTPPNGRIEVRLFNENSNIAVEISDSGQGIKPEFLPYVFERFRQEDSSYTRQIGGLGLGLAIVRHLVELHDGTVSVKSAGENQGAVFTVELPISVRAKTIDADSETVNPPPSEATKSPKNVRILVIEDDEDSREMLKIMFEQNEMEVFSLDSTAKAIESIERIKPDVLISDIGLPGEDGYELIRKVRLLAPEQGGLTPAIALTGYVSLQDRSRALDVGYQEHLSKPVDIDKLLDLVKKIVSRREFDEK